MSKTYISEILIISILFVSFFSQIHCSADSINLNKKTCIFKDQIKSNQEIISFEYYEGYYRPIHENYGFFVSNSVKMKYLGDSSKDLFMKCLVSINYSVNSNSLLHYHIPCYLDNIADLNEGNYCIEIVKTLIGDIKSESYCDNDYILKVTKSTNIPSLNVIGFASDVTGCVQRGENVMLLATVKNKVSNTQDLDFLGIGISSTEALSNDISLACKIEGKKSIGLSDKITCIIPDYISEGYYSIFYSPDLVESEKCPNNIINSFNSLDFLGDITKLKIYKENDNQNIEAKLTNITFDNPSKLNLTFSLNDIQNKNSLSFNIILNQDIGIKLIDNLGIIINTKCDLIKSNFIESIFYLICTPEYYEKDIQYSLLILDDISIGYDLSQVLCTYEESSIYGKIIIKSAEYDFFIIYNDDDNTPYLDCNLNDIGFYQEEIIQIKNLCGYCSKNC